jgi:hypothetical protein
VVFDPAAVALEIDAYYDGLLYDGMSELELQWVENQRAEAHARAMKKALAPTGFRQL